LASASDGSCLAGKWAATEAGFTKSFTFNSDGTGIEVQSASDTRNFTWTDNGKNIHIVYPAHGDDVKTEWDLGKPNCPKQEYPIYGLVYRK
jgi:hypothetical protein